MTENSGFEETAGQDDGRDAGPGAHRADGPLDAHPDDGTEDLAGSGPDDAGTAAAGKAARPEEAEVRGRYVEGSYGKAGVEPGRLAEDEEGRFVEGDYGKAGTEGGRPEPLGSHATESGRYIEADYGDAGSVPPRTAESEIGQYAEGDYGEGGTVDPKRKPEADRD